MPSQLGAFKHCTLVAATSPHRMRKHGVASAKINAETPSYILYVSLRQHLHLSTDTTHIQPGAIAEPDSGGL